MAEVLVGMKNFNTFETMDQTFLLFDKYHNRLTQP